MSVTFGKLQDLPLRDAWTNEARDFTPWLAENIDHIAEAIGVPLELTGQEVAVETFSADILARNPADGTVVLIENQLEQTDHTHLGQIMTYLAGLEAQTVVWIAPSFREPHLSAIRWLNEHTADGFAFFAVRLRVVRIGDSPYAPVFEVVEKPNAWERVVGRKKPGADAGRSDQRLAFWTALVEAHPDLEEYGPIPNRTWNAWLRLWDTPEINLSLFVGNETSGGFLRAGRGQPVAPIRAALEPHRDALLATVGTEDWGDRGDGYLVISRFPKGYLDETAWPEIIDWMNDTARRYASAVKEAMKGHHA